ncbi:MAG: hypothetical protein LBD75_05090 [Candidatus Peribacteria bacterium]|nr:hypothetical protein [Candidatus Peribacteria bacterium]
MQPTEEENASAPMEEQKAVYSEEQLFGKMIQGEDMTGIDPITQQKLESREKNVSSLSRIPTNELADMVINGQIMSGSQAMRDLKRFDSEKYVELQQEITKKNQLSVINSIAS